VKTKKPGRPKIEPSQEKELFKLWVEKIQLEKFKQLSEARKLSIAWLMRDAFDQYLKAVK